MIPWARSALAAIFAGSVVFGDASSSQKCTDLCFATSPVVFYQFFLKTIKTLGLIRIFGQGKHKLKNLEATVLRFPFF